MKERGDYENIITSIKYEKIEREKELTKQIEDLQKMLEELQNKDLENYNIEVDKIIKQEKSSKKYFYVKNGILVYLNRCKKEKMLSEKSMQVR